MTLSDTELARELRAVRPEIDSDFAAELDAWAAEGFPSAAELAKRDARAERAPRLAGLRERFRSSRRSFLLPAMAGATAILLVAVVTVGVLRDDASDDRLTPIPGVSDKLEQVESAPVGEGGRTGGAAGQAGEELNTVPFSDGAVAAPPVPPTTEPIKPGQQRIQEKSASLTLSADADEVRQVADGVVDVVDRYDGIVVSSNVSANGDRARATFDLRIPSQNLEAAMADFSDLASVQARSDGVLDITAPFVSAEERFDEAKAEVDSLVAQLAEADSLEEAAQVREQLRIARAELAAVRADLAGLKQRAQLSTVSLTVVGEGDADGWSIGDAIDDAGSVLESIGGALLVALAAIVPFALLAGLAWLGWTRLRRRRREQALDRS